MAAHPFSTLQLADGATLAYEILGSVAARGRLPVALVGGMGNVRSDWERLAARLSQIRPVLIYDHRGMGDSHHTSDGDITIESMSRDLAYLLHHIGWKEVAICGFSMGGVIAQQLLLLPFHPIQPTSLSFRCTHLLLACTRSVVLREPKAGLPFSAPALTPEARLASAKRILQATFDPMWLQNNPQRFAVLFSRTISGSTRSGTTIAKQKRALETFNFERELPRLSRQTRVLVLHGQLDQVIPFHYAQDILRRITWATMATSPNHVPSLNFGHYWYEYFDAQVWVSLLDNFLRE